jgi:integrin alpha 8
MAYGRITKLPYIGETNKNFTTHEVSFTAIPDQVPVPDVIPLWIFVLAACAGALILLLLIYLLYKVRLAFDVFARSEISFPFLPSQCGFFKRNRPQGSPHERQPLNRNGNYHGDEHL